jgi:flagellar export protein FliJ
MADALATLHRLRRLAGDEARRALAAALAAERAAEAKFQSLQAAMAAEAASAPNDAAHPLAGAYANWLPAAQAQRTAARAAMRAAEAEVGVARAALAQARAAARAVEVIEETRAADARHARLRRDQIVADDLAGGKMK